MTHSRDGQHSVSYLSLTEEEVWGGSDKLHHHLAELIGTFVLVFGGVGRSTQERSVIRGLLNHVNVMLGSYIRSRIPLF